ncbi:MAG: RagB/SusD family nutrient uptake outer membrane protein, partial [Flavisolibacter sp.]|nr:RagB/SusD family nutrient uptake outer membrane protein [Flavisolibacter sp.]
TKPQVIAAIMHEKMVELGDEEIRNRDILRWRKKGYFTSDPLPYFRANRDELLPVPQQEIDNNPKLGEGGINKQNPGY